MSSPARPVPQNYHLGIFPLADGRRRAVAPHEVETCDTWQEAADWLEARGIAPDGDRLERLPGDAA